MISFKRLLTASALLACAILNINAMDIDRMKPFYMVAEGALRICVKEKLVAAGREGAVFFIDEKGHLWIQGTENEIRFVRLATEEEASIIDKYLTENKERLIFDKFQATKNSKFVSFKKVFPLKINLRSHVISHTGNFFYEDENKRFWIVIETIDKRPLIRLAIASECEAIKKFVADNDGEIERIPLIASPVTSLMQDSQNIQKSALNLVVSTIHHQGMRNSMEDTDMDYHIGNMHIFGVFDGHSGRNTADYAAKNMGQAITKDPNFTTNTELAMRNAFSKIDQECCSQSSDGATVVVALIDDQKKLWLAHAGDARGVLVSGNNIVATQDHKAYDPLEKARVEAAGGAVWPDGYTWRVGGRLAVSRALGDRDCKHMGVISDPDIQQIEITPDAEFLVLACDGVWDVLTSEQAVRFIKQQMAREGVTSQTMTEKKANVITQRLVNFVLTGHADYNFKEKHQVRADFNLGKIKKEDVNMDEFGNIKVSTDNVTLKTVWFQHQLSAMEKIEKSLLQRLGSALWNFIK